MIAPNIAVDLSACASRGRAEARENGVCMRVNTLVVVVVIALVVVEEVVVVVIGNAGVRSLVRVCVYVCEHTDTVLRHL